MADYNTPSTTPVDAFAPGRPVLDNSYGLRDIVGNLNFVARERYVTHLNTSATRKEGATYKPTLVGEGDLSTSEVTVLTTDLWIDAAELYQTLEVGVATHFDHTGITMDTDFKFTGSLGTVTITIQTDSTDADTEVVADVTGSYTSGDEWVKLEITQQCTATPSTGDNVILSYRVSRKPYTGSNPSPVDD